MSISLSDYNSLGFSLIHEPTTVELIDLFLQVGTKKPLTAIIDGFTCAMLFADTGYICKKSYFPIRPPIWGQLTENQRTAYNADDKSAFYSDWEVEYKKAMESPDEKINSMKELMISPFFSRAGIEGPTIWHIFEDLYGVGRDDNVEHAVTVAKDAGFSILYDVWKAESQHPGSTTLRDSLLAVFLTLGRCHFKTSDKFQERLDGVGSLMRTAYKKGKFLEKLHMPMTAQYCTDIFKGCRARKFYKPVGKSLITTYTSKFARSSLKSGLNWFAVTSIRYTGYGIIKFLLNTSAKLKTCKLEEMVVGMLDSKSVIEIDRIAKKLLVLTKPGMEFAIFQGILSDNQFPEWKLNKFPYCTSFLIGVLTAKEGIRPNMITFPDPIISYFKKGTMWYQGISEDLGGIDFD